MPNNYKLDNHLLCSVPCTLLPTPYSLLPKSLLFATCYLLFIICFISCQTAPKIPETVLEEASFIPLDTGASVYVIASVKEARSIIDLLPIEELNDKQTRQMLESTDFLAAALFPRENERRFQLAAWGNYPSARAGIALAFNRQWKKQRSPAGNYWRSQAHGLSIALSPRQAFAAAVTVMPDIASVSPFAAAPGVESPEGFGEFRRGFGTLSIFSCWLEDPGPVINRIIHNSGLPIRIPAEKLFISLLPAGEAKYEAVIRLQFQTVSQARAIVTALSFAGRLIPVPESEDSSAHITMESMLASVFFANPPVQNDRSLDIKTAPLSDREIAVLFGFFLVN